MKLLSRQSVQKAHLKLAAALEAPLSKLLPPSWVLVKLLQAKLSHWKAFSASSLVQARLAVPA